MRGVIRRQAQADTIKAARSIQPYQNNLEFVVVPDLLKDGAYDDVLDGVSYILHCASPIPSDSQTVTIHLARQKGDLYNDRLTVTTQA